MNDKRSRILIVDDEKTNLDVLVGILSEKYKTVVAKNGEQALARSVSEPPPDLILLDVQMPEMDGFEVCRRLKENITTQNIPVIFVTAMGQEEEVRGLALGAVDYVNKPINPIILMARIKTHLALSYQSRILEQQVMERTKELEKTQDALREAMGNLLTIQVGTGVFWLQIPEAGLYILCGCPSEVVKLLMRKGLNTSAVKNGVQFETGPNVILLSDLLVQNGGFSNLAEFPVLQMLYRQGMIIPGHPNNTGVKPMLMGSSDQIRAQLEYIHRGNYGLLSKEEIMASGIDEKTAEIYMRVKLKFAFGQIREPSQFLQTLEIDEHPQEIRNGVTIQRISFNQFRFTYRNKNADIDLNLQKDVFYKSPYSLGHHRIKRHYFAVLHTGSADGWDPERNSMSSVLMFQGRIYLLDVVPGIINSLNALGIDISEVEGIFHTHSHDDHFAGLPELICTDRRLKYFATPLVRSAVAKKFAALMSINEEKFSQFFEIHDLEFDKWNKCDGFEVMTLYSPHPVENNLLLFRALDAEGYRIYAHWADLASFAVMDKMVGVGPNDVPSDFIEKVKADYLRFADMKKIDIGGGMIHGMAKDFAQDPSKHLVFAHLARPLTTEEMAIGSEASFGSIDILIAGEQDYYRQRIFSYLRDMLPEIPDHEIRMLINGPIVNHNVGAIIRRGNTNDDFVDMIIAGEVIYLERNADIRNHLGFGSFMGLSWIFSDECSADGNYRALSHGAVLKISISMFKIFLENNGLYTKLKNILQKVRFLNCTWLFGEQISFSLLSKFAQGLVFFMYKDGTFIDININYPVLWIVIKGKIELLKNTGELQETIAPGGFFGEHIYMKVEQQWKFRTVGDCELYQLNWNGLLDSPIIHWKMLEICQKRLRRSLLLK